MAAKKSKNNDSLSQTMGEGDKSSTEGGPGGTHVIRDLIGSPTKTIKSRVSSPDHHINKGSLGSAGHFMNVVEHHEEEEDIDSDEIDSLYFLTNLENMEAQRGLNEIIRARKKMYKRSMILLKKLQM